LFLLICIEVQESAMDTSNKPVASNEPLVNKEPVVSKEPMATKEPVASEEPVANKDGEEKLILVNEGHASSTQSKPSDEVTVQTSSRPPEDIIKPSPLTPIVQQETPRSMLTPVPNRSFSCFDQRSYFTPDTFGYIPPPIARRHTYPPHNQLGNSSNYSFGYSSSGADVIT
jgi:hypothetical protein